MKPPADLNAEADTIDKQRAFMRFAGERGKATMTWVTCNGVVPLECVAPDLFREILSRNRGSHYYRDVANGTRCHQGCDKVPSLIPL